MNDRPLDPLPPRHIFLKRLARTALLAMLIIGGSLVLGVLGYHYLEGLSWIDSLLNGSMILSGMGPVAVLTSPSAKLFASAYAMFSAVVFLVCVAVMISPVIHRVLHRFHMDMEEDRRDD